LTKEISIKKEKVSNNYSLFADGTLVGIRETAGLWWGDKLVRVHQGSRHKDGRERGGE